MIFCTNCGKANDAAARLCHNCGARFGGQGSTTPFQTTDPYAGPGSQRQPPPTQQQPPPANPRPIWQTDAPPQGMQQVPPAVGLPSVGTRREPVLVMLLPFLTCGIYLFYWWYVTSTEIRNAVGRNETNPGLDLLLGILTCGLYYIYLAYREPQYLLELQDRVGLPRNDITVISLILYLVFSPVTLLLIQTELNKIWEAARQR